MIVIHVLHVRVAVLLSGELTEVGGRGGVRLIDGVLYTRLDISTVRYCLLGGVLLV